MAVKTTVFPLLSSSWLAGIKRKYYILDMRDAKDNIE